MKLKLLFSFLLAFAAGKQVYAQQGFPFANEIKEFKHQDSLNFPKLNGILFIGSSSIRLWSDLEQRFPGKPIIKRGVGGCELWQIVDFYTPYILFPYHPRKVFIYAGENDIAAGKKAAFVYDEFQKLWEMIHQQLPKARIYFMSVKPSPSRAKYFNEMVTANNLIKEYISHKPKSYFIDVSSVIYKENTSVPDSSLFKADFLHLNSKGYDRWQKVLTRYVK
jgi:hypothetical protein